MDVQTLNTFEVIFPRRAIHKIRKFEHQKLRHLAPNFDFLIFGDRALCLRTFFGAKDVLRRFDNISNCLVKISWSAFIEWLSTYKLNYK